MMGEKGGGTRGRERDGEFQCHKINLLKKIIPCSPVATHTQTLPRPSVLSLNISIQETSLFLVSWQVERVGLGAKVCEETTAFGEEGGGVSRWCGKYGFERR